MAVYTSVTRIELSNFLKDYDIGQVRMFKGIEEGIENSNYFLETKNGKFILTLFEKRINPTHLPFFIKLMIFLQKRGVLCPRPIESNNGHFVGKLSGRPAVIVSFLEGAPPKQIKTTHCGHVGRALGLLHTEATNFTMNRLNDLSISGWKKIAESLENKLDNIQQGLRKEIMEELIFLESVWPIGLPSGVIHADLFPDNVFFLEDDLSGLIDFYFACTDSFAYDLAVSINAWCFETQNHFNIEKSSFLLKNYQSKRRLSQAERIALPILARGSALRFLLTRCYDWINTPKSALVFRKDPLEFWERWHFHKKVQSSKDYGVHIE